jgi:hypothetical protein
VRPRANFGPDPKGRLPATMLRALAAELSDPSRFKRAKAYARDQAVFDIQVDPGVVRGMVQGSRSEPYEAVVRVSPLSPELRASAEAGAASAVQLLPGREDLAVGCTCPDIDAFGTVCKHALATLLVFADEVSIEPGLLTQWRSGGALEGPSVGSARAAARGWAEPMDPSAAISRPARVDTHVVDVLAERRRAPVPIPPLPTFTSIDPVPITDDLTEVLALAHRTLRRP